LPKEFPGRRKTIAGKTVALARNSAYLLQATVARHCSPLDARIVIVQRHLSAFGHDIDAANLLYLGTGVICFLCPQTQHFPMRALVFLGMDFSPVRETMACRQMLF
jgi:hypothetical protein